MMATFLSHGTFKKMCPLRSAKSDEIFMPQRTVERIFWTDFTLPEHAHEIGTKKNTLLCRSNSGYLERNRVKYYLISIDGVSK